MISNDPAAGARGGRRWTALVMEPTSRPIRSAARPALAPDNKENTS